MGKIAVIGAGDFQVPLILKAKELGYETHVFAWRDGAVGEKYADRFYPVSVTEKEKILSICKEFGPDAVATIASDISAVTVQYIAKRLGLLCNSDECIKNTTNKFHMRQALRLAGVETPLFTSVSAGDKADFDGFRFPVVVKPTDRSGSRGIMLVNSKDELDGAIASSAGFAFEKKAIVEEYIGGSEYSCECISFGGLHEMLAVTKKYTTGAPNFIETAHIEPSGLSDGELIKVKSTVFAALDALDIKYGASHSEFKLGADGVVRIIEIGARMGGDCIGSHLVRLSTGVDFLKAVIDAAAGKKPLISRGFAPGYAAVRFVFTDRDIEILNDIKKKAPDALRFVSEIESAGAHSISDSASRLGYYVLACETEKELKNLARLD